MSINENFQTQKNLIKNNQISTTKNNTLKKLLLLLLIAPVLGFGQNQKKLEKTTKVEIINRYGFDETATFAFYATSALTNEPLETMIFFWEEALLSNGLKLGSWKIEDKTIKVDADYFIEWDNTTPLPNLFASYC